MVNNSALFWGEDAAGHEGIYGVFGIPTGPNPGPLVTVVQQGMPVPGGSLTFMSFNPGARVSLNPQPLPPGISGDNVAFWGQDSGGGQGIYVRLGINGPSPGPVIMIANLNTPVPGGSGTFRTFNPGDDVSLNPQPLPPGISGNNVVFWGEDSSGHQGIYGAFGINGPSPGPVVKIANLNTPAPGGVGNFSTFAPGAAVSLNPQPLPPGISGDNVVFWGQDSGGNQGVYGALGLSGPSPGPVVKIASLNAPVDGGMGTVHATSKP